MNDKRQCVSFLRGLIRLGSQMEAGHRISRAHVPSNPFIRRDESEDVRFEIDPPKQITKLIQAAVNPF